MIQIDFPAILAALEWRHLWWVVAAGLVWSLAEAISNLLVSRMFGTREHVCDQTGASSIKVVAADAIPKGHPVTLHRPDNLVIAAKADGN